jgi:polar amino acid transport system permease protein
MRRFLSNKVLIDIVSFILLLMLLTYLLIRGGGSLGYRWQWYRVLDYIYILEDGKFVAGPLLKGLVITFRITVYSLILTLVFGLTTALMRLSDSFVARVVSRVYLELIRNTPLLVQIFFIYFVLAPVLGLNRFLSAVIALSLFEGAYSSEIFRAGIVSISKGQWEAASSLGLRLHQTYRYVILPQAIRRIIPPLTSQAISLIKDSALVSTIAVYDLTMEGQAIISDTFLTFEIWFTIAAMYLVITVSLSVLVNVMEHRLKVAN